MEESNDAKSEHEYAYKKKSTTVDKRALRLHRRSIEWKSNRDERINSARNLNMESLSPLQEISQNTPADKSYDGKTPTKSFNESSKITSKGNMKEAQQKMLKERLAKWKKEKELKRKLNIQEKAKSKPFKVSHIDYKDLEKLDAKIKATKALGQKNSGHAGPTRIAAQSQSLSNMNKKMAATKTSATTKSVISKSNSKQVGAKISSKPSQPVSSLRNRTGPKASQPPPPTRATSKIPPAKALSSTTSSKAQITGQKKNIKEKKSLQIDLQKVSTSRGQSFAPEEFTFTAPSNLSSFVFRPLSPNAAASFLNPSQDAGASFIGTDPKRCSTPKSSEGVKEDVCNIFSQENLSSEQTFKGDSDETLKSNETPHCDDSQGNVSEASKMNEKDSNEPTVESSIRTRSRSQHKGSQESLNSSRIRTRSSGRSLNRSSKRMSIEKRTLDRSSSRRLSQGSLEKPVGRPRTRSTVHTSSGTRSASSKRTRANAEHDCNERASKRSKSVHMELSHSPEKKISDLTSAEAIDKPVQNLKEKMSEEEILTPKRKSMRLSRKSLSQMETSVKISTESKSAEEVDDVFDETNKRDDETIEIQQNSEQTENQIKSLEIEINAAKVGDEGEKLVMESEQTENQIKSLEIEVNAAKVGDEGEKLVMENEQTSDKSEVNDVPTPSRKRKSVRRSLHSKNTGDEENIVNSDPISDMLPKPIPQLQESEQSEENNENVPTAKRITRSTKRRSMSCVEGFAKPSADSVVLSANRNPNKRKRRKTVYDHTIIKSPEEWIKLLQDSPMVEMNRRTPKQKTPPPPALDFDLDLDELEEYNPNKVLNFSHCGEDGETASNMEMETNDVYSIEQQNTQQKYDAQELQVDEVSTTQDSDKLETSNSQETSKDETSISPKEMEEVNKTEEHDVAYFRRLLISETDRLNQLCQKWDDINNKTLNLSEDVRGQLRTVVGQAQLLIDQRFKQFTGLVDNCEFKQGEKETTCTDLQGFWDMIFFQIEDVNTKFSDLGKLQENNWNLSCIQPEKKIVKKKVNQKLVVKKPVVKSKFAAFRAGMKNKNVSKSEDKTFDFGFFKVQSPVKSPNPHCEAGSPKQISKKEFEEEITITEPEESTSVKVEQNNLTTENTVNKALLTTPLRTPLKRKSYVPNIPSPLLQDITPQPRTTRSSTYRKTPLPKNILSDVDDNIVMDKSLTNIAKDLVKSLSEKKLSSPLQDVAKSLSESKPRRRSLRTRKSVSFCDSVIVADEDKPAVIVSEVKEDPSTCMSPGHEDPFSKYLQPSTPRMSMAPKGYSVLDAIPDDDSFTTHAEAGADVIFSPVLNSSHDTSQTGKSRSRHSSLKQLPTRERRRSARKSVQFISPTSESNTGIHHILRTPPTRSVSSNTSTPDSSDNESNRFPTLNVGYTPVARSTRPSLLFTPPNEDNSLSVTTDVPTGQLISFTP